MFESSVPRFEGNINFNAQHSPMGAFMSFTCGHAGSGGGIGMEIGKPASQNLFIGVKDGPRRSTAAIKCLPFVRRSGGPSAPSAADYDVERAAAVTSSLEYFSPDQLARHFGWATDRWSAGDLSFTIFTPFGAIKEPGGDPDTLRSCLLPAVIATLRIDNRLGTSPKTGVFAIDFVEPGARLLQSDDAQDAASRVGFAWKRSIGVLGTLEDDDGCACDATTEAARESAPLLPLQRWSVADALTDVNAVHELGTCAGLSFEVPPGEARTLVLAIGGYLDGTVTTGIEGRYLYTRCFTDLQDVLHAALDSSIELRGSAARLDAKLLASKLSTDQQFMIAHATRSYYGSTQLLEVGGQPMWVVNEGEYCMMNTLDLSIDHAFWELKQNPWVVRNLLDSFVRYYSYHDEVKVGRSQQQLAPGGLSFSHDMGAHNNFSRFGHSSYELPNLTGCFSYMTHEQLCNWVLLAATYVKHTRDVNWLRQNRPIIEACATSMFNRGGELGFAQYDSSRCESGAEITTYDSLDHSLAQTRNNLYIAVKCWATYIGLDAMFEMLGDESDAQSRCAAHAKLVARTIVRQVQSDGTIPAVFEKDNPGFVSRILPAIEGLLYPLIWGVPEAIDPVGEFGAMLAALRRHTQQLLRPGTANLFADGGIKLSSTSNNSWMSKIVLFQIVARQVFHLDEDAEITRLFARADAAHTKWQTDGSSFWACSDQFVSGVAKGSRYYPRIITAALWMDEVSGAMNRHRRPVKGAAINPAS